MGRASGERGAKLAFRLAAALSLTAAMPGNAAVDPPAPGAAAEARLPRQSPQDGVGLGFPVPAHRLPAVGTLRFAVIFVDFPDAVALRTPESVFAMLSPDAESFFQTVSYGRLHVQLTPTLRWLRMNELSTAYGWPLSFHAHRAYILEALTHARAAGTAFADADSFIVIGNPDATALRNGPAFVAGRGWGVRVGDRTFENGATSGHDLLVWGYKWFDHEVAHTLSLPDLYSFTPPAHRFVGGVSLMGLISGRAPEYFAWERWNLGWLDDNQVVSPPQGVTDVHLTPVERPGGVKLAVVPIGYTAAVAVECRAPLGYDRALAGSGPVAYVVDTSIASGQGPIRLLPLGSTDGRTTGMMRLGELVGYGGVSVRYVSDENQGAEVEITRQ